MGEESAAPVPGTEDGVLPAWSPDGSRIAFTRLARGEAREVSCVQFILGEQVCRQERTVFPVEARELVLVRPDGSESRALAPGQEPAWTPAGQHLVFEWERELWITPVEEWSPERAEGTFGGREPAVSPDGSLLVFAREVADLKHDLWIVALPVAGR